MQSKIQGQYPFPVHQPQSPVQSPVQTSASNIPEQNSSQAASTLLPSLNSLYKTQLCKHYQQNKHCHVGNKCHFAHGENELRKKEDVSILKSSNDEFNSRFLIQDRQRNGCQLFDHQYFVAAPSRSTDEDAQHPLQQLQDLEVQILL
ncbi:hypothetical protein FGO68_gene2690 [Halteria grandinella]|uniref:C3H1-type domain-containing protein n=1 Tax=Halteria grandinella TaxID=5974 RepID=A0A8J8P7Y1_HALGN|nr:hypothetical protein FGO68_gene2690 [Halteria grandinella]